MKRMFSIIGLTIFTTMRRLIRIACCVSTLWLLVSFATGFTAERTGSKGDAAAYSIMDRFDMFVTNTISDSLDGVWSIEKVYWLSDDDLVAPEPDQDKFGATSDPATMESFLDDASKLLNGQSTLFRTDVALFEGSEVQYYLDDTIMVITWKQVIDNAVYTFSEVKIADPSQFRRFLAGGQYASDSKYYATEMATSVNAVLASNADFYSFRDLGIVVYDSKLMRAEGNSMDTCFIHGNGDIGLVFAKELTTREAMQQYVDEHEVRFSISFGPILIKDGELIEVPLFYPVGDCFTPYARAALCQLDELHYVIAAVNPEPPYGNSHTIPDFAENLRDLGIKQAYNLDGGQSATIVMNDQLVNYVYERLLSDIIYFATAIPNGG